MKKQLFSFLLLLSFVFSVSAQKPDGTEQNLRKHVGYLASEQLEGRRTGERGAITAAGYVAKMFANYKLKDGMKGQNGGQNYLQQFPYVSTLMLGEGNFFEFKSKETGKKVRLKLIDEWMPLGFSASESLENLPLVDVGYGITAKNLNYDDYRGIDARNCAVLAIDTVPDRKFEQYADIRRKALAAREAGAKVLIILADVLQEKYKKLSYDNLGDAGIPVVVVSGDGFIKTNELRLPKTGAGVRSGDGTEIHSRGDISVTTKPDGTVIIEKPDGTTFTYKTEKVTEGNSEYIHRKDGRTVIKYADGTTVELENDYLLHERTGEKEEDFTVSLSVDLIRKNSDAYNVIGILEGKDAVLKSEAVIIGAHYDHLGKGGAGSLAVNSTEIHHGADDNASGVSAMLELARQFAKSKDNKRTLIFMAFGGEEEGLLGSKAYVNNPVFPLDKTVAMINLDMVGRLNEEKLTIGGIGTASEWKDLVAKFNSINIIPNGLTPIEIPKPKVPMEANANSVVVSGTKLIEPKPFNLQLNEDGFGPSDHSSFYGKQIPVLFFFTGTHADYHKPSDTAEKINYDGLLKITNYVGEIVKTIDQNPKHPTYAVAKSSGMTGGRTGFNISLGTVPSYAEGKNDGLLLDGVRDDSPAAKAGIKAGDKIVKMAGRDVHNISDYVFVLGEMKAGEEYEIVVVRGAEMLTLKIVPAARK